MAWSSNINNFKESYFIIIALETLAYKRLS
jgi:hypothetical protein